MLLGDAGIAMGASPKSAFQEQSVQIPQGGHGNARRSEFHACADPGIGHPGRQYRYNAWSNLNMEHTAIAALLAVLQSQTASVTRMPTVMDLNLSSDMGRMTM